MLKLRQTLLIGIICLLLLETAQLSFAAPAVGVKPGDWIKYQITLSYNGTASGTINFGELGAAEYVKSEILTVIDTTITAKMSLHMKNGTDITQMLTGNVATGTGNLTMFIAPSGMQKGDSFPGMMFGSYSPTITITDTVSRTCCGTSRTVNMYSLSVPPTNGYSASIAAYWDQSTGVLTELSMSMAMPEQTMDMKILATETNMWTSGIFSFNLGSDPFLNMVIPIIAIAAAAAGIAIITLVFLRKRNTATAPMPMITPAPVAS